MTSFNTDEPDAYEMALEPSHKRKVRRIIHLLNRFILVSLVLIPFSGMSFLTLTVLAPSLKNPEAKFYSSSNGYPAKQRARGEAIDVETVTVGTVEFTQSLSAPGESVAIQSIEIRPEVQGVIESVLVEEGDWVSAGQMLIQLNQKSFLDEVEIAENNVANDRENLRSLSETTANNLAKLTAEIANAEARVANAQVRWDIAQDVIQERRQETLESASIRFQNASERLERIQSLVEQGALPKFALLEAEDEFTQQQHELFLAQQGSLSDNTREQNDWDYLLNRQLQLEQAKLSLEGLLTLEPGQIEEARLRLETGQARLREALRNLERTTIVAPSDGLISQQL